MSVTHKTVLYFFLIILGLGLFIPAMMNMLRPGMDGDLIFSNSLDGKNHLRAVNGTIAAIGLLALWSCYNLENSRQIVLALGIILAFAVIARIYSIIIDGIPGLSSLFYLAFEVAATLIFIIWAPPVKS